MYMKIQNYGKIKISGTITKLAIQILSAILPYTINTWCYTGTCTCMYNTVSDDLRN